MNLITYQDIVDMCPCDKHHPRHYIPETWSGTVLDVLGAENVAPTERLWVSYRLLDDKILRLFAVNCARRALVRQSTPDPRSVNACDVAEKFAMGLATTEELAIARDAAAAAVYTATAAYAAYTATAAATAAAATAAANAAYTATAAATAAAATAAYTATANAAYARKLEREMQIIELIRIIGENT